MIFNRNNAPEKSNGATSYHNYGLLGLLFCFGKFSRKLTKLTHCSIIILTLLIFIETVKAEISIPQNLPQRPNIVFILVDDLGYGDLKSFNPQSKLELPSIDRLAREGRIFTDAHSPAALCAPSRYSVLTGNYTWRGRNENGVWRYYGIGSQILPGQWTLGDILKQAGYKTGIIGKYHLGGHVYSLNTGELALWTDPDNTFDFSRPLVNSARDFGFDFSFLNLSGTQAPPYAFFRDDLLFGSVTDIVQWEPGEYGDSVIEVGGIGLSNWDTTEIEKTMLEQAVEFINLSRTSAPESPFFLYYPLTAVHSPFTPPTTLAERPIRGMSGIGDRGDMIHVVDAVVGEILATLEDEGILDETLIIFTSDNGAVKLQNELVAGHDATGGLGGIKGDFLEGGHRVPLIVRWGNGSPYDSFVPAGTTSNALIGIQDFVATIAQLVGVDLPPDQAMDSFNMTPALFADNIDEQSRRDHLLSLATINNYIFLPKREFYYALREDEWKLVVHFKQADPLNPIPISLFNLMDDLYETTDLISDPLQADRVQGMLGRFIALRASTRTAPSFLLDLDGDGVSDTTDNCKFVSNENQQDTDTDNAGDACDVFPNDPSEWIDTDGDGIGNNADPDDDNDGLLDLDEITLGTDPLLTDSDGDGFSDGDEVNAGTNPLDINSFTPDGDINMDGIVNVIDFMIGQKILTGQIIPTEQQLNHGDVAPLINGTPSPDGQFTLGDVVVITRKSLGEISY